MRGYVAQQRVLEFCAPAGAAYPTVRSYFGVQTGVSLPVLSRAGRFERGGQQLALRRSAGYVPRGDKPSAVGFRGRLRDGGEG